MLLAASAMAFGRDDAEFKGLTDKAKREIRLAYARARVNKAKDPEAEAAAACKVSRETVVAVLAERGRERRKPGDRPRPQGAPTFVPAEHKGILDKKDGSLGHSVHIRIEGRKRTGFLATWIEKANGERTNVLFSYYRLGEAYEHPRDDRFTCIVDGERLQAKKATWNGILEAKGGVTESVRLDLDSEAIKRIVEAKQRVEFPIWDMKVTAQGPDLAVLIDALSHHASPPGERPRKERPPKEAKPAK